MAGKELKPEEVEWNFFKDDELIFAVNPKISVNKLTNDQI
jgi:hypothetical protein